MKDVLKRVVRLYWREALVAVAPFFLLLPVIAIEAHWIGWILPKYSGGWFKYGSQIGGEAFIGTVFSLPTFVVDIAAGGACVLLSRQRTLRLALVFGVSNFVVRAVLCVLLRAAAWQYVLNFFHIALPVLAAWVILRFFRQVPEGHCHKCAYNLTGNVSGVCPECGTEVPERAHHGAHHA